MGLSGEVKRAFAEAVREARIGGGFTQAELAGSIGLRGRAVMRWESGQSIPRRDQRAALLRVLSAAHPASAATLARSIEALAPSKERAAEARAMGTAPVAAPPDPSEVLERAVFRLADALDLPPRRVRGAMRRFLQDLAGASFAVEPLAHTLEAWIQRET